MSQSFPKSDTADICLLLEGTFPFVRGGVSSWVYQLINTFPQYRFAVIFLGGNPSDYKGVCYDLPKNLVHLEDHYLFANEVLPNPSKISGNAKAFDYIEQLHREFRDPALLQKEQTTQQLSEFLVGAEGINEETFLYSKKSWNFLVKSYEEHCPNNSFIEYFWNVRNLHSPLWKLANIVPHAPKVKVFHTISTGYAGFLGALLHYHYQRPLIVTEHGIYTKERWIELQQQWWFQSTFARKDLDSKDAEYLVNMWINFFSSLARMCYSAANPIISLFDQYQDRQIRDGADPARTIIIPNALDLAKETPTLKTKPDAVKPIIAFIGRVVPIKDIKTYIRAVGLLVAKIPDLQAWIVGSWEESPEYADECKNLVKILGLDSHIVFKGEQKVAEIYSKIDLLILSSVSEGLPLVILESFAAGVPVVATDVGACRQLIYGATPEDKSLGVAGEIVGIADPQALARAIYQLLENSEQWMSAQQAAKKRVAQFYNLADFIAKYGAIYERAIN